MPMSSSDRTSDETIPVPRDATRSEVSGGAGDVVQAQTVSGGVHFHGRTSSERSVPRQLPGDVRGFVNRTNELDRLDTTLLAAEQDAATLIVLVGTAGVGKTALALRWAHRARARFPDGQLYVNMRGYDPGAPVTPDQALDRFLRALDVTPERMPADLEAKATLYRSLLSERRMLIVLDNAASVRQVRPLLPGSDTCRVIVTSRSRLIGLIARDGARRITVEILAESEAVELVGAITSDYRLADDPADIAELARLCACLPLALRIAAERAAARPWMPLAQLIQDLRDESGLWDALSAEGGEEADAVRTVFAWSYRALPVEAARMFRLLGLHPGPEFGVHAAAALADVTVAEARHLVDMIVNAHLVEEIALDRYQFHDLLRAYATDAAHHEESLDQQYAALNRVLAWYLHTAHAAGRAMRTSMRLLPPTAQPEPRDVPTFTDYLDGVRWYDAEWPNLLAAVQAAAKSGLDRMAWQLGLMLRPYFTRQVSLADRLQVIETALASARRDGDALAETEALAAEGGVYAAQHRLDEALEVHRSVLRMRRALGDREGELLSTNLIGVLALLARRFADAIAPLRDALALSRALGDVPRQATALFNLAEGYAGLGRYDAAADAVRQSLSISRELGDLRQELVGLVTLARIQADTGALNDAFTSAERALALAQERGDQRNEGWALLDYGRIQLLAGRYSEALISFQRATTIHIAFENKVREAASLDGTGEAYQGLNRMAEAVGFHRRAVTMSRELADRWLLATTLDHLATTLTALGATDEAFQHWQEALEMLADYTDPTAQDKRASIVARLTGDQ